MVFDTRRKIDKVSFMKFYIAAELIKLWIEEVEDDEITKTKQVDQKEYQAYKAVGLLSIFSETGNLVLIPGKDQNAWHNDCKCSKEWCWDQIGIKRSIYNGSVYGAM